MDEFGKYTPEEAFDESQRLGNSTGSNKNELDEAEFQLLNESQRELADRIIEDPAISIPEVYFERQQNPEAVRSVLSLNIVQSALRRALIDSIFDGDVGLTESLIKEYELPESVISSSELQTKIKDEAIFLLGHYDFGKFQKLFDLFGLPDAIGEYNLDFNIFFRIDRRFTFSSILEFGRFIQQHETYFGWLENEKLNGRESEWLFDEHELDSIKQKYLRPEEAHVLVLHGFTVSSNWTETGGKDSYEEALKVLSATESLKRWQESDELVQFLEVFDEDDQIEPTHGENGVQERQTEEATTIFERASKRFGYRSMFQFCFRDDVGMHDMLHAYDDIEDSLFKSSGLKPSEFFGQILFQVKMDSVNYQDGASYHRLNTIAQSFNPQEAQKVIKELSQIPEFAEMSASYKTVEDIFSSWASLKKFHKLQTILGQQDLLNQLKTQGHTKLIDYIRRLAFGGSSVSIEKVLQFWKDPSGFLNISERHARRVHELKKPSHYTEIPHLDLTPEELRDSLVEGDLDSLQVFHPLEIEYTISSSAGNLRENLTEALGSREAGIKPRAKNPKKLYSAVKNILDPAGISLKDYLQGQADLPSGMEDQLGIILKDDSAGLVDHVEVYRAKIYSKSDPESVVAGNDTSCCMPFGSGKNNIYTFNPICSTFVVQRQNNNGSWRTIAQSILTEDVDIHENIHELMQRIDFADKSQLREFIPQSVLEQSPSVVTADNIEVSPNFAASEQSSLILEQIYRDFFQEYSRRYLQGESNDGSRIIVGKGYSEIMGHLPEVNNTFLPRTPVAYSDNIMQTAYQLDLWGEPNPVMDWKGRITETYTPIDQSSDSRVLSDVGIRGLSFLGFRDALPVSFIEGKAYEDNPELLVYLHNMENALIAKDINNSRKKRSNMSLKWQDSTGKIHGYILAYEGVSVRAADTVSHQAQERILYISDLASDSESKLAGGYLIKGFFELYRRNYLEKGDFIPIVFEGREQTSYSIVAKQISRIASNLGYECSLEEGEAYKHGNDIMHPVVLRFK